MLHKNIKYYYKIVIIKRKNKIKKSKGNSHARKCQFSKCALKQLLKKFACGLADGYTLVGVNKNQE